MGMPLLRIYLFYNRLCQAIDHKTLKIPQEKPSKANRMKQTIVTRHKVGNIDIWLKGHEDRVKLFSPVMSSFRTFQDTNDPNSVVLVFEDADLDKLGAIINDPKNKAIKELHTVLEPITLSLEVPF